MTSSGGSPLPKLGSPLTLNTAILTLPILISLLRVSKASNSPLEIQYMFLPIQHHHKSSQEQDMLSQYSRIQITPNNYKLDLPKIIENSLPIKTRLKIHFFCKFSLSTMIYSIKSSQIKFYHGTHQPMFITHLI